MQASVTIRRGGMGRRGLRWSGGLSESGNPTDLRDRRRLRD